MGTISVKETKAPAGYLPDTKTRTYTVDGSHIGQGGVVELAPIEIAEDISSFDIELVKYLDSGNEGSGLQPAGKGHPIRNHLKLDGWENRHAHDE